MTTLRGICAAFAVAGTLVTAAAGAQAAEAGRNLPDPGQLAYPGESYSQYGGYYGRRYYDGGYYRRGYGGGAAAAGIAGLAAGALVAGAIASQPGYAAPSGAPVGNVYGHDPNWVSYCASRYRSFDPASGTYLANDGNRYVCQ